MLRNLKLYFLFYNLKTTNMPDNKYVQLVASISAVSTTKTAESVTNNLVGRNLSSTKKESIEIIRTHQIEKKSSRQDSDIEPSIDSN